ncbi:MAG: SBBP repeat-containing protein [Rhodospirillales bacterium]|nr:SBBP repeat-containing protein [Rhodospirillales bacterium]
MIAVYSCLAIAMGSCNDSTTSDDTTTAASTTVSLKLTSDSANNDVYISGHTGSNLDSNTVSGKVDIFLIKYNASGIRLWSRLAGGTENDYLQGITITPSNQTVMTGYTYGALDDYNSIGGVDMLLVKTAADGNPVWEKQFGTDMNDYAYGVTTDSSGDIYVAGHTYGSFQGTISGTKDFVLLKFDSSGDQIWARQLGNDEDNSYSAAYGTYGIAVKTDNTGNVYGAGFTSGALTGNSSSGEIDLFVVKYDSAGNLAWIKQLGSAGNDYTRSLQVTKDGNVYLTGYTDAGLNDQTHAGENDIFLVKLNTSGGIEWTRQVGTVAQDYGNDIAVDSSGDIYLTGYTTGALEGDSLGGSDILLMKYDATGDLKWTKQLGTSSAEVARAITIDSSSDVYTTGYTYGELDGNSNASLTYTSFLSHYDASGDLSWTKTF